MRPRQGTPSNPTVGEWLTSWRELFPGQANPATIRHDLEMVAPFRRRYASRPLADVTPLDAQRWALAHPQQVRWLRHAWEKAVLMGLVPLNVWKLVETPPRSAPERRPPTQAELDAAVHRSLERAVAVHRWWEEFADVIVLAAYTGARLGGLASLRRSEVFLGSRRLVLHEKGSKTRTAVLTGPSGDAMARALERRPWDEQVFRARTRAPLGRSVVGEAWRRVRGEFPHGFHALRHFAATWLTERGVDPLDVAIQLGHVDRMGRPYPDLVRRIYVHPDHDEALARIERLG